MVWQYIKSKGRAFSARSETSRLHNAKHGQSVNSCQRFCRCFFKQECQWSWFILHPLIPPPQIVTASPWMAGGLHMVNTVRHSHGSKNCLQPNQPLPSSTAQPGKGRREQLQLLQWTPYQKKHPLKKPSHLAGSNLLRCWQLNSVRTSPVLNQESSVHTTLTLCLVKCHLSSYILHESVKSPN